jgi:hypothetical protein
MTKHGRGGQTRHTAPDSITANPEMRNEKGVSGEEAGKKKKKVSVC